MNATQRTMRAQKAAHTMWAGVENRTARTAAARRAAEDRFTKQVQDQFPNMRSAEVAKRAESLRRAYFVGLAMKSAQSRAAKAAIKASPKTS
jgi:hypothetical protein